MAELYKALKRLKKGKAKESMASLQRCIANDIQRDTEAQGANSK